MPILIVILVIVSCKNTREESEPSHSEQQAQLQEINRQTIEWHKRIVGEVNSFYTSLYILPIQTLEEQYLEIDSLIEESQTIISSLSPAETDSLFWKKSLLIFEFYDSAWETNFKEMLLLMEEFESAGLDQTHKIQPLMDSVLMRESQLLKNWTADQERIISEYGFRLDN